MIRTMLVLVILASSSMTFGQVKLENPRLHALVLQGIDLTWQQAFHEADTVFQRITDEFPDHPAGFVYRAGLALTAAEDHESLLDRARFDSLLDIGRKKAQAMLASESEAKWGHFFLATADGSDSYARVYRGDWVGGTLKGFAAVGGFERALNLDSSLVDALGGIGAYKYWRSRKTEYFNWLPFVGDARPEAITMLRKTADNGIYNRFTVLSMLSAIYLDAEQHEEAVLCARLGLKQYPTNRTFLWALATVLDKAKKPNDAARAYEDLLASIETDPAGNAYNEFVARLNLAESLARIGDAQRASVLLKAVLQVQPGKFAEHLQSRARNNIERARQLEKRLTAPPAERR